MVVVEARNLSKTFGTTTAVNGISFTVNQGEVFGFLGPNGAGKTTTMRIIECISPRTGGDITVFSLDPTQHPRDIKARLGIVPQESNLDPDLTSYENLSVYARYFGIPKDEARKRAEELLRFVALEEKHDVLIEQLSGGMKRRLILARALINNPELLVLDEPTVGLDPQARHLIWEKLRSLRSSGRTIILTTHYLDEAARLCDRLVIMDEGKILVEGSPSALVRENLSSGVVEAEDSKEVRDTLLTLDMKGELVGGLIQIATDNPHAVARTLLAAGIKGRIIARETSLEDLFLKLTGRSLRE